MNSKQLKPRSTFLFLLLFPLCLLLLIKCHDKETLESGGCDFDNYIKSVEDAKGIIWFDSITQSYSVFTGIDGSYDLQDVGIPCNLPDDYHAERLEISFSGKYYGCDDFPPRIPGQTYYYLKITKIEFRTEE